MGPQVKTVRQAVEVKPSETLLVLPAVWGILFAVGNSLWRVKRVWRPLL